MKKVKILSLIAVLALVFGVFAGCADTKKGIVMGTNPEFPPFEYVETEEGKGLVDKYDGVDIVISQEIAKALNKELSISAMEFDSLIPALKTGKIDFIAAGMTIKEDRKENVDFSEPYYTAIQSMIVQENSPIKSAADLDGKKVGVVNGYTGDFIVTEMVEEEGKNIQITRFKTGTDAVLDLKNGRIDAVVIDLPPAKAFASKNPGLKVVEDSEAFSGEEYGIAVKKGNKELLDKINEVIKDLKASGKVEELVKQYSE